MLLAVCLPVFDVVYVRCFGIDGNDFPLYTFFSGLVNTTQAHVAFAILSEGAELFVADSGDLFIISAGKIMLVENGTTTPISSIAAQAQDPSSYHQIGTGENIGVGTVVSMDNDDHLVAGVMRHIPYGESMDRLATLHLQNNVVAMLGRNVGGYAITVVLNGREAASISPPALYTPVGITIGDAHDGIALSETLVVAAYQAVDGGSRSGQVCSFNLDSAGTLSNLATRNYGAPADSLSLCRLTATSFVLVFRDPTNGYRAEAQVGTVAAGSLTMHSVAAVAGFTYSVMCTSFSATRVVVGLQETDGVNVMMGTVSGTTINFSTPTNVDPVRNINLLQTFPQEPQAKIAVMDCNGSLLKVTTLGVSGNTLTVGTTSSSPFVGFCSGFSRTSNTSFVIHSSGTEGTGDSYLVAGTWTTPETVSFSRPIQFNTEAVTWVSSGGLGNGQAVVSFNQQNSTGRYNYFFVTPSLINAFPYAWFSSVTAGIVTSQSTAGATVLSSGIVPVPAHGHLPGTRLAFDGNGQLVDEASSGALRERTFYVASNQSLIVL